MNMRMKNYKIRRWQDVTIEECREHRDFDESNDWTVAAIKNAISYGDICGSGLDVRCEYVNEVVNVWKTFSSLISIKIALFDFDWKISSEGEGYIIFTKSNDVVSIDFDPKTMETAYLTMIYGGKTSVIQYYDKDDDVNQQKNLCYELELLGVKDRDKQVLLSCRISYLGKSPQKYLEDAKTNNFIIVMKGGEPRGGYNEPFVYSDIGELMADFCADDGDAIITEYQYWTDNYQH